MKFLDFKQKFSEKIVFSLRDVQFFDSSFNPVQLSQWQKQDYIIKLIKGRYIFSDLEINEEILFLIANELLHPSYISLETALSWYGVIPEGVFKITSVSTARTVGYKTKVGDFSYKNIKQKGFFGITIKPVTGTKRKFRIATLEKAIVDTLYFNEHIKTVEDIEGLRFNDQTLENDVDITLLKNYAQAMENKRVVKNVDNLIGFFEK